MRCCPKVSNLIGIQALAGGDKPRHYKQSFTGQVGVGFIPTREFAWYTGAIAGQSLSLGLYKLESIPSPYVPAARDDTSI